MTLFNKKRLAIKTFKMDEETKNKLRQGWYSDAYFNNVVEILTVLANEGYKFGDGKSDLDGVVDVSQVEIGNIEVEMQVFTSRKGKSIIGGVDEALVILKECTGYYDESDNFVNTSDQLDVEAVYDGAITEFYGDKTKVQPVIKIRGLLRDFGHLETSYMGVMVDPTRLATNTYNVLTVSNRKPILFFPARFMHYKMQAIGGYAYWLAIQRYKKDFNVEANASVSTAEQGDWWGGKGSGTLPHSSIAAFLGNTAKTMMQYARIMPTEVPRIVLCDFHNDCVTETLDTMDEMWLEYWKLYKQGKYEEAKKYILYATRPDTSSNLRDQSVVLLGDKKLDNGVNPRLVYNLRKAIDERHLKWIKNTTDEDVCAGIKEAAKKWCEDVKIVVTGGFDAEKIKNFEEINAPVDIYGVGSAFLENSSKTGTNNDFTADIVRVKIHGKWYDLSKYGRLSCDNSDLKKVDMSKIV